MSTIPSLRRSALVALALGAGFASAHEIAPDLGNARWGRDYFPNVELTTHEGKTVRFFDDLVKDKVVLVNFIYTSCPDACPLETAKIAEVQRILGERVGTDTFFYSISIDPGKDTPEVLADYARRFGAGPGWTFLTGREADIALIRTRLGLFDPEGETKITQHNLSMVIGNQKTGRWMKSSPMENSHVIATQIGDWLHNWKRPRDPERDYANAPRLRNIGRGESLFRTRCAACHLIGGTTETTTSIGPDLLGVTERRERRWLERWLEEPDKMLEEKDPLALHLYERFNHVPMPNARLGAIEIAELLDFLAAETARIRATRPAAAALAEASHREAAPCCAKKKSATIGAAPEGAAAAVSGAASEPDGSSRRASRWSPLSLASIGLGLALGVVATRLRRRAAAA